jgi:competence protein ComEC
MEGTGKIRQFHLAGWQIAQIKGKTAEADLAEACSLASLVIVGAKLNGAAPLGCEVIDEQRLRQTGPLALWPLADGRLALEPTHNQSRLWTGRKRRVSPPQIFSLQEDKPKLARIMPDQ